MLQPFSHAVVAALEVNITGTIPSAASTTTRVRLASRTSTVTWHYAARTGSKACWYSRPFPHTDMAAFTVNASSTMH